MENLLTMELIDTRICDTEKCTNTETYREYIHRSLKSINYYIDDETIDNMTDEARTNLLEFADKYGDK